jgi:NADH-quinone oxidoreductase subunit J
MDFTYFLFFFFSVVLLGASAMVVVLRNPVHAALFLVVAFFNAASLWMLLSAEFLAITLVLVYVGAVMVLFLFVVMMLDINIDRVREGFWKNLPLALVVGGIMVAEMTAVLAGGYFDLLPRPVALPAEYSNTKALGRVIYTNYAYAFEIAAVILLVAIIAAIALTHRKRHASKYQNPALQVKVRRQDRIRLLDLPVEKKE